MNFKKLPTVIYLALFFGAFFSTAANSQNANVMHLSGVNDYITAPAASQLILNATGMSLTCWVYPSNTSPTYPDFDGFAGIRNDVNADFYMVQVGANSLESRFRNSAGAVFSLTSSVLVLNTWQHLAFTYDGSMERLYVNGVLRDSIAANGTITTTGVDFNIGNVHYVNSNVDFLLKGMIDEVSFWSSAISSSDLQCVYKSGIDTAASGLQLYYKFNQGVGGGNNTAITSLKDEKNAINGNFVNVVLTGSTSNFVSGSPNSVTTTAHICRGGSYTYNGNAYTNAGIYTDTLISASGCDSLVSLNLIIDSVNTNVTQIANFLFAPSSTSYQWVNCTNGYSIISGATNDTYTVPTNTNFSYAVILTQNGCVDTSACIAVNTIGIDELKATDALSIYPSLFNNQLTIENKSTLNTISYMVMDMTGRIIINSTPLQQSKVTLTTDSWSAGTYTVIIQSAQSRKMMRVVKM